MNDNNDDGLLETAVAVAAAAVSAVVASSVSGPQPQKSQRQLKRKQDKKYYFTQRQATLKNHVSHSGCRDDDIYDEDVDQPQSSRRNLSPLPQNTAANQNEIILHALSPKMAHGKIINWLKVEREEVRRYDIVAIISGNDCGMKYELRHTLIFYYPSFPASQKHILRTN